MVKATEIVVRIETAQGATLRRVKVARLPDGTLDVRGIDRVIREEFERAESLPELRRVS